jgi:hypothetical protein
MRQKSDPMGSVAQSDGKHSLPGNFDNFSSHVRTRNVGDFLFQKPRREYVNSTNSISFSKRD